VDRKKHHHEHGDIFHSPAPVSKMKTAFFLTFAILLVEVTGGLISHSLALLSTETSKSAARGGYLIYEYALTSIHYRY